METIRRELRIGKRQAQLQNQSRCDAPAPSNENVCTEE
jgi:hypothetical protein